ncbi:hypothetical protein [Spirosoma litoris]
MFVCLIFLVALSSCQDHQLTALSGQKFRIKREVSTGLRLYSSTVYNYNSQGQLANSITRTGSSSLVETGGVARVATFKYDEQGRLVQFVSPLTDTYNQRYDYSSDNSGNITSVKRYEDSANPGTYVLTNTYTLEYGTGKAPIKVTNTSSANVQQIDLITYNNGNITKIESSYNSTPITNYTATAAPNPFYGLVTGQPNIQSYSVNVVNVTGVTYINTYDSNGFLIKQVEKVPSSNVDNERTFEYEAY